MTIVITSLVVCAVGLVVLGLLLPSLGRDRLRMRLSELAERPRPLEEIELEQPFSERVWRPLIGHFARLGERLPWRQNSISAEAAAERMRRRLEMAGSPGRWTPADWLGIKLLCALGTAAIVGLLFWSTPTVIRVLIIAAGVYGGYILPEFWLKSRIRRRQKAIRRALPDTLDLLVVSVRGGLGFDAAVAYVAAQNDNPLTEELSRMLAEMRVGRARHDALREMATRTDVSELTQFAWALIQADRLGVSVVQVLVSQAEFMRVQRRQHIQEEAQKAPLKMIFPLGIFIFPALCIVLLGPAVPVFITTFKR